MANFIMISSRSNLSYIELIELEHYANTYVPTSEHVRNKKKLKPQYC